MRSAWKEALALLSARGGTIWQLGSLIGELEGQLSIVGKDSSAYGRLLQACRRLGALAEGKRVEALITSNGLDGNVFLGNHLIGMYARCGSVDDALRVFSRMPQKNLFTFTAMIDAYAHSGQLQDALGTFQAMQQQQVKPDKLVYSILLNACTHSQDLDVGIALHEQALEAGLEAETLVATGLVKLYGGCGHLDRARRLFDNVRHPDVILWNTMIFAYAQKGQMDCMVDLLRRMQLGGHKPDGFTFTSVLSGCSALALGRTLHSWIDEDPGKYPDLIMVETSLMSMYIRCGSLELARAVFDRMERKDVITWSAMISQYEGQEAFRLLRLMQLEGVQPDRVTYIHAVTACQSLKQVESLATEIVSQGLNAEARLGNALVHMYAKMGDLQTSVDMYARIVEPDVSSWNSMIGAYAEHNASDEATELFFRMLAQGVMPDEITFMNLLGTCGSLERGKLVHACAAEAFDLLHNFVIATCLIDFYGRCGDVGMARNVFHTLRSQDLASWNAMIGAYAEMESEDDSAMPLFKQMQVDGLTNEAVPELDTIIDNAFLNALTKLGGVEDAKAVFESMCQPNVASFNAMLAGYAQTGHSRDVTLLLKQMQHLGIKLTPTTFVKSMEAFSVTASVVFGTLLYKRFITESGYDADGGIGNALINFYSKCGNINECRRIFEAMERRDIVSWTIMVVAYAQAGRAFRSMHAFNSMQQEGLRPNYVTFIGVLSACSHAGMVNEGWRHFRSMSRYYGIVPQATHYGCMVDLLSRAGRLDEAEEMMERSPFGPGSHDWGSLLAACKDLGDTGRTRRALTGMMKTEPESSAGYVALSNVYIVKE